MSLLMSVEEDRQYFVHLAVDYIGRKENALAKLIIDTRNMLDATIDATGTTLLHFSARAENVEITNYLLGLGVNVDAQDRFGSTPLIEALHKVSPTSFLRPKNISIVKMLLIAGSNYRLKNYRGFSALQLACNLPTKNVVKPNVDIIKLLLERVTKDCENECEPMAKILMENHCSLERAMFLNNADLIRAMVARGCDVDQRHSEAGTTALHAAVNLMSLVNVKALIELGADVYAEDKQGFTPLQYYCKTDYYNMDSKASEEPEIVRIMLSNIENVNKRIQRRFIVGTVASMGNEKALNILLQYDVDLHAQDDLKSSLLFHFAKNRCTNVVALMKETKLDLALRGTEGAIMLTAAVANANASAVQFLLESGANPNTVSKRFKAPILAVAFSSFRVKRGSQDTATCIALLLEYGANVQWTYHTPILKVLRSIPNSDTVASMVVRHLAIDEVSGKSITMRREIASKQWLWNCFYQFKQNLEKMSKIIVFRSLTMFALLSGNEESILRRYAYNHEFLEKLESMNEENGPFLYYDQQLLHKRVARMISKIKLIRKTAPIVCDMIGEARNMDSIVVRKIISYLDFFDMQMINKLD